MLHASRLVLKSLSTYAIKNLIQIIGFIMEIEDYLPRGRYDD